jgi:hypothetical protein
LGGGVEQALGLAQELAGRALPRPLRPTHHLLEASKVTTGLVGPTQAVGCHRQEGQALMLADIVNGDDVGVTKADGVRQPERDQPV